MAHETTHILYEWEEYSEVEIAGEMHQYSSGPRSLILHRLDDLKHFPQIPDNALKTPVWWSADTYTFYTANGQVVSLPYKLR